MRSCCRWWCHYKLSSRDNSPMTPTFFACRHPGTKTFYYYYITGLSAEDGSKKTANSAHVAIAGADAARQPPVAAAGASAARAAEEA
jgi:hypothetical protein